MSPGVELGDVAGGAGGGGGGHRGVRLQRGAHRALPVPGAEAAQLGEQLVLPYPQLVVRHIEVERAARDVDDDAIAVLDQRNLAAAGRLR